MEWFLRKKKREHVDGAEKISKLPISMTLNAVVYHVRRSTDNLENMKKN